MPGPARGANLRRLATDSQRAHALPGTDDVAFYEAHGWWVSPPILDEPLVDAALAATESYYAGELDDGPPIPANDTPQPPYGDGIRGHLHAALRRRELGAVAFDPVIGAIAARLAGASTIRLFHDQLIYKPREAPGAAYTRIGWHTDGQYWLTCTSRRMITAWIPLHDVDAELGSLMVLDRSHRWSDDIPGKERADGYDQDLDAKQRLLGAGRDSEKVVLSLRKGQVSFHHMLTYHASGPNTADRPRHSLTVHMQDGDNRHSQARLPDGSPAVHAMDALVRSEDGVPDYADPRYCPVLFDSGAT